MSESPLHVLVLAGGISHERDVSLRSGARVADLLRDAGAQVTLAEPDAKLLSTVASLSPDVIWPALHGASGEDGALRDILELTSVPYVGTRPADARLAWDKPTAKTLATRVGVSTPAAVVLTRATFSELDASSVLSTITDFPVVVKPAQGGSAQGVSIVEDAKGLPHAMVDAYSYSDTAFIEHLVVGTEVAITVIDDGTGPKALPIVEIIPVSGVYSFEARYNAGETNFRAPALLDDATADRVRTAALKTYSILGMARMGRLDFIIDADGTPWFLDANVAPGTTDTSLTPLAIRAAGVDEGATYLALAQASANGLPA